VRLLQAMKRKTDPLTQFSNLGLTAPILKALDAEGYAVPTPIQAQAIPIVMAGRDLLGIAQTGTGKTAAFALPILHKLAANRVPAPRKGCRVLVLSPTRELATQIAESFRTYGRQLNVRVAVVFGGVGHRPQVQALAHGVDVLVATPGRLLDHVGDRSIVLATTEIFVLDEADQMLDLGFVKPIRRIVAALPHKRQSLFFSATMPREIGALANELLRDPAKVSVAPSATTVESVSQRVIHVESSKKRALLKELFADQKISRALVFTRTKRGADRVAHYLETAGVRVAAIHGNKSQRQREQALEAFRTAHVRVLVATDIAARGIDIDQVSHVVNYELPDVAESYVHRIGRTARAGAAGAAISLCDAGELDQLREIERVTRQRIPSQDRRNDASLLADATGGRPHRARHARAEAQRNGSRGHRVASNGAHRGRRFERSDRSVEAEPRQQGNTRVSGGDGHRPGVNGGAGSGMAGIGFMAAPVRGESASKVGESGGQHRRDKNERNAKYRDTRPGRGHGARPGR
jgi:ATP-dependent RNA helicase RhlE